MKTIIVSIVKNKSGDICDVNNYRPIALVTVASNIFEIILLDIFELSLQTSEQVTKMRHELSNICWSELFHDEYVDRSYGIFIDLLRNVIDTCAPEKTTTIHINLSYENLG